MSDEPKVVSDGSLRIEDARKGPSELADEVLCSATLVEHVETDELNPSLELLSSLGQVRSLDDAGAAPRCPHVEDHGLSSKVAQEPGEGGGVELRQRLWP